MARLTRPLAKLDSKFVTEMKTSTNVGLALGRLELIDKGTILDKLGHHGTIKESSWMTNKIHTIQMSSFELKISAHVLSPMMIKGGGSHAKAIK